MDHQRYRPHLTIPHQLTATYNILQVTPGSSTFDSGSSNFTVPAYNTLTVEIWGAGGAGSGDNATTFVDGNPGTSSSVSTLSMTAAGGGGATSNSGGVAGSASGGNTTNTSGNNGGAAGNGTGSGVGAGAPNGGASTTQLVGTTTQSGTAGNAPGGGGGGTRRASANNAGGASGAYSKSVYTRGVTSGAPTVGSSLAYAVGASGTAPTAIVTAGNGANGRVKFTWA